AFYSNPILTSQIRIVIQSFFISVFVWLGYYTQRFWLWFRCGIIRQNYSEYSPKLMKCLEFPIGNSVAVNYSRCWQTFFINSVMVLEFQNQVLPILPNLAK